MLLRPSFRWAILIPLLLAGFTIFMLSSTSQVAPIRTINGTVTEVLDGHLVQVTTPEQTRLRIRLYGIDAPETARFDQYTGRVNKPCQPYGRESKEALENKIMGRQVKLDIIKINQHKKRMVGIIWIDVRNINLV